MALGDAASIFVDTLLLKQGLSHCNNNTMADTEVDLVVAAQLLVVFSKILSKLKIWFDCV